MQLFLRFMRCKEGATAIEYGLIGTLISIALIAGLTSLSNSLNNTYSYLANEALGNGKLGDP